MDPSRFDRLSEVMAELQTRRGMLRAGAALPLAVLPFLQVNEADAKPDKRRGRIGAEHWNKKKRFYCLNGETIRRYRRKQETLLAMDATLGKCGDVPPPPCVPTTCEALEAICGPMPDGCGVTLQCGICSRGLTCCSGQCVDTQTDNNNCGECGTVCDVANFFECSVGLCQTG